MAPKPRPIQRKPSMAPSGKEPSLGPPGKSQAANSMPPPPVPVQPPPPQGLLVPEARALSGCLRAAAIRSGQVFRFYADTQKLHIHRHAPYPPRALVSSLGRELEKYDQLCDAIQYHIGRAVNALKRDLEREQDRIKAEERAAMAAAALAAARVPPNSPMISPTSSETPELGVQGLKGPGPSLRRQSTISLSSLHRPAFPHKLDLSSAALRLSAEDLGMQSGLASPVMLAPTSSISRIPPDFPFGAPGDVDIDLTMDDDVSVDMSAPAPPGPAVHIDPTLGNSADKPIVLLDLDMFADPSSVLNPAQPMNAPPAGAAQAQVIKQEQEAIDFGLFQFPATIAPGDDDAKPDAHLLAALGSGQSSLPSAHGAGDAQRQHIGLLEPGPSPASLLAGLQTTSAGAAVGQSTGEPDPANFGIPLEFLKEEMVSIQALFDMPATELGQGSTSTSS